MPIRRILDDGTLEPITLPEQTDPETGDPFLVVRHIGSTRPATEGWAINNAWLDTTSEANTLRLWTGSAFSPAEAGAPVLGTLLLADDFSGIDGAAWDAAKWAVGTNPLQGTGGGATLLSNVGVLTASNYGNYAGDSTVSRRAIITDTAAINMLCSFKFDATSSYFSLHTRHSTNTLDRKDGYYLKATNVTDDWELGRIAAYSTTQLGTTQSVAWVDDTWYKARLYTVGTAIKAKVWLASVAEPGAWNIEVTDSTYTAAGKTGLSVSGGATSALPRRVFVDDLTIRAS